jgi:hypothetical protein
MSLMAVSAFPRGSNAHANTCVIVRQTVAPTQSLERVGK